ncbi:hypothetical protein D3C81_287400 [compost metagenome]
MIIEREESVILEEGANLADQAVGGLWIVFRNSIPFVQGKELDDAFNLIMIADPDSLMPSQITQVLVDESMDIARQKQTIFVIVTTNIIDQLERMGITVHDEVGEDKLEFLYKLVNVFFELEEYQDLIGLKGLLESYDIPPVNRLLAMLALYWGEEEDLSEYECMIKDISESTLKSIKDSLFNPEDIDTAPKPIQDRIIANKKLLEGTIAYRHVTSNGQLGGSVRSFLTFFERDLQAILHEETPDAMITYARETIGLYLISEINNEHLKDKVTQYLYSVITDMHALMRIERMIEQVVIP